MSDQPSENRRSLPARIIDSGFPAIAAVVVLCWVWWQPIDPIANGLDHVLKLMKQSTVGALGLVAWAIARQAALPRRATQAERRLAAAALPATLCRDCLRVARGLPHSCWRCESTNLVHLEDEDARQRTVAQLTAVAAHLGR